MADQTALTAAQVKQINFTDNDRNSYKIGTRLSDLRFRQNDASSTGIFKADPTLKGNIANITLTAAEILKGVVTFDTNNGNRTVTVPTAATIVAAISAIDDQHTCEVGDSFYVYLVNMETNNNSATLTAAAGSTLVGDVEFQGSSAGSNEGSRGRWLVTVTNANSGAEAVSFIRVQ